MNHAAMTLAQGALAPSAAAWIGPALALAAAALAFRAPTPSENRVPTEPSGFGVTLLGVAAIAAACAAWAWSGHPGMPVCIAAGSGYLVAALGARAAERRGLVVDDFLAPLLSAWAGAVLLVFIKVDASAEPRQIVPAALGGGVAALGAIVGCARGGAARASLGAACVLTGAALAVCGAFEVPHVTESNRLNLALRLVGTAAIIGALAPAARAALGKAGPLAVLGALAPLSLGAAWWMLAPAAEAPWLGLGLAAPIGALAAFAAARLPRGLGAVVLTGALAGVFALCDGADVPLIALAGVAFAGAGALALPSKSPEVSHAPLIAASVAATIAMVALLPIGVLRAHEAAAGRTAIEGDTLSAEYLGHRRFRLINPALGSADTALLVQMDQFEDPHDLDHLEVGLTIPATVEGDELEGRLVRLKARTKHGDHYHNYNFLVVASRFGTRADGVAFHRLSIDSPRVWAGAALGAGVAVLAGGWRRRGVTPAVAALGTLGAAALLGVGGAGGFVIGAGLFGWVERGSNTQEIQCPDGVEVGPAAGAVALAALGLAASIGPGLSAWLG